MHTCDVCFLTFLLFYCYVLRSVLLWCLRSLVDWWICYSDEVSVWKFGNVHYHNGKNPNPFHKSSFKCAQNCPCSKNGFQWALFGIRKSVHIWSVFNGLVMMDMQVKTRHITAESGNITSNFFVTMYCKIHHQRYSGFQVLYSAYY